MPTADPTLTATVADLVAYWSEVRENGPLAASTVSAYLGTIGRVLRGQGITAATPLDDLDLPAILNAHSAAHPDLQAATLTNTASQLRAAINGYRTHHRPDPFTPPAPETAPSTSGHLQEAEKQPTRAGRRVTAGQAEAEGEECGRGGEEEFDGTLAHLEPFTDHARRIGLVDAKHAAQYKGAIRRILASAPQMAAVAARDADPVAIIAQYAAENPGLANSTLSNYRTRLARVIDVYTVFLAAQARQPLPSATAHGPLAPATPALEIPLPGERTVRFSAPADLTDQEAAATGAVLRLHHPGLTSPAATPGTWTLVFWPEHAPDQPEAAHLTGPSFRRALAAHIRGRCPELTDLDDEAAIDAWYATEVFFALAFTGHHNAHDSGALL